jgi:hypothetical protein
MASIGEKGFFGRRDINKVATKMYGNVKKKLWFVCASQLAPFQKLAAQHLGEEEPGKKKDAPAKRLRRRRWNTKRRSRGSLIVRL